MNGPYHVEIDQDGCRHCGSGRTFWVIGADDVVVADSQSFEEQEGAEYLCEMLNDAFEQGQQAEIAKNLKILSGQDKVFIPEIIKDGETVCGHGSRPFECKLCNFRA